jgi:integrase
MRTVSKGELGPPKTDAARRSVDLPPFLCAEMSTAERRVVRDSPWIFPRRDGNHHRSAARFRKRLGVALAKAELRPIRLYDLRHTYASLLLLAGVNVKYIQAQMGHTSVKLTLDRYAHLIPGAYDGVVAARLEHLVMGTGSAESASASPARSEPDWAQPSFE